jgi:hypothetical protein
MSPQALPIWATIIALLVVMALLIVPVVPALRLEIKQARRDRRTLPFWTSYTTALARMETRSVQGFMRFARQRIPPDATVLIAWDFPTYGYYRGAYDLYPRHVWDIVPVDIVSNRPALSHTRPRVTPALLRQQLLVSGATYLVVWRVPMPLRAADLPPIQAIDTYRPNVYVVHLAWALGQSPRLARHGRSDSRRGPTTWPAAGTALRASGRDSRPAGAGGRS